MSTQTENAKKYMASMVSITTTLWANDGTRLFKTDGGAAEGERIVAQLEEAKKLHPRSKCWKEAMSVWAALISETMDEGGHSDLDWAVLQGCTYAGWKLPTVPLDKDEDVNMDELADEDL